MSNVTLTPGLVAPLFKQVSVGASFNSDEYSGADVFGSFGISVITANQSSANWAFIVQGSSDGVNYGDFGTSQAVTADGTILFNVTGFSFPHIRVKATRTAGSADFTILCSGKQL